MDPQSLRILIACYTLEVPSGSATAVRDIAVALRRAGHDPTVFSPRAGLVSDQLAAAGIPVVTAVDQISATPQIIHGNHCQETIAALREFPDAKGIFVCHDRFAWHSTPPLSTRVHRYVAVDLNCRGRLTADCGIPETMVRVVLNTVDTCRFKPRPPLPSVPRRALIFSNYAGSSSHLEPIQMACARLGIELDVVGLASGTPTISPEAILGRYDLVFAKAKCALEAMATGCAVVLCDARGLGPMVMADEVERLRDWNFGMRLLRGPLATGAVLDEISRYDPRDAAAVADFIRAKADIGGSVAQFLGLYREVLEQSPPEASDLDPILMSAALSVSRLEEERTRIQLWKDRLKPFFRVFDFLRKRSAYAFVLNASRRIRTRWRRLSATRAGRRGLRFKVQGSKFKVPGPD